MIIDSTIAERWFLNKGFEKECLKLREEFERGNISLQAPEILIYEVGESILRSKIPTNLALKLCALATEYLRYIVVDITKEISSRAIHVGRMYDLPFNSSLYLSLSEHLREPYVTLNEEIVRIRDFNVVHLNDLDLTRSI